MLVIAYESSDAGGGTGENGQVGVSIAGDASMMLVNTATVRVVPTIAIDLRLGGINRMAALLAHDAGRHHSTFSGGLGVVIWNRFSVAPRLVIPFGPLDQSGFQLTVGYNWTP